MKTSAVRYIILLCAVALLLFCSCAEREESDPRTDDAWITSDATAESVPGGSVQDIAEDTDDLSAFEKQAVGDIEKLLGQLVSDYVYIDMDRDGNKELLCDSLLSETGEDYIQFSDKYFIAYADSDGSVSVVKEVDRMIWGSGCQTMETESETIVIFNYSTRYDEEIWTDFFALRDGKLVEIAETTGGRVYVDSETGEMTYRLEERDWGYIIEDGEIGGRTTLKLGYLYYDGADGSIKEYGAREISEEEFLSAFANADEFLGEINAGPYGGEYEEYKYYIRANGVLHVQVFETFDPENEFLCYNYYTCRYDGGAILPNSEYGDYGSGLIREQYTGLEAAF